ncbi:DUF5906 domain-containing protein [Roseateles sp. DC23W]|uniref:DUF5906 domain-containing protein n=1 Tax=Pelomonas dachongensis TaxID=3299029 RepID=A0ABW7EKB6_9BURK
MTVSKEQLLADLLANIPAAMRERRQWLVWKLVQKAPGKKPSKLPFYANGNPRGWPNGKPKDGPATDGQPNVQQGHELDRAVLVSFDEAVAVARARGQWAGVGFAFLPGDGLLGVDVDHAIDQDTGELSEACQLVMALCPSYTELSVSGTGIHVILEGHTEKFKDDLIGLEVYCDSQFFTCTGHRWGDGPADVRPVASFALTAMRALVEKSIAAQKAQREAELAAAAPAPVVAKPQLQVVGGSAAPKPAKATKASKGDDFRRVNDEALAKLSSWVPVLFPGARADHRAVGGYRVSSQLLKRDLEEDLAITPAGIKDFGPLGYPDGKPMTAIDCVMEWRGLSARDALHWLAPLVSVELTPPKRASGSRRPEPPAEGQARESEAAGSVDDERDDGDDESADEGADTSTTEGEGGKGKKRKKVDPLKLQALFGDYAYQYGSDIAWCVSRLKPVKIGNLRHTFGGDAVRVWMAHDDRRMVEEEHVVFEPGVQLGPQYINLYAGMPLKPLEGDVAPMLELLQWLCGTSTAPGLDHKDIADWVLRWCALLVQRPGVKMKSALVFHGPQGTGKNLFFDVLRDLFGDYGVMVGQTEIEDKYNTWLSGKMLIIGDEVVSRAEMFHAKNRLKWIITQTTKIPIRAMHMDTRWESNHANLVFLSNEDMPLVLEEGDRRFMVVYTPNQERGDLYARVVEFLANDGARKWLHFLQTIPLSGFTHSEVPPLTRAKQDLIELGYRAPERFVNEWHGGYLDLPLVACSAEQLYRVYKLWCDRAGERFPGNQSSFTSAAKAFARKRAEFDEAGKEREPFLTMRDFTGPHPDDPTRRKSWRIWLPRGCGPRDEDVGKGQPWETQGHWAASVVKDFSKHMFAFSGRHRGPDDEGDAA